jgi:hypothetical protein
MLKGRVLHHWWNGWIDRMSIRETDMIIGALPSMHFLIAVVSWCFFQWARQSLKSYLIRGLLPFSPQLLLTRGIFAPPGMIDCGDASPQFRPESYVKCHDSSSNLLDGGGGLLSHWWNGWIDGMSIRETESIRRHCRTTGSRKEFLYWNIWILFTKWREW